MHKLEAIRLINKELTKGEGIPEAIILAIMSFSLEASEMIRNAKAKSEPELSPFKAPFFLMQW
jgi:hypothetical protein